MDDGTREKKVNREILKSWKRGKNAQREKHFFHPQKASRRKKRRTKSRQIWTVNVEKDSKKRQESHTILTMARSTFPLVVPVIKSHHLLNDSIYQIDREMSTHQNHCWFGSEALIIHPEQRQPVAQQPSRDDDDDCAGLQQQQDNLVDGCSEK